MYSISYGSHFNNYLFSFHALLSAHHDCSNACQVKTNNDSNYAFNNTHTSSLFSNIPLTVYSRSCILWYKYSIFCISPFSTRWFPTQQDWGTFQQVFMVAKLPFEDALWHQIAARCWRSCLRHVCQVILTPSWCNGQVPYYAMLMFRIESTRTK